MCWRKLSKLQRTLHLVLFYLTLYLLISYALSPKIKTHFISEEFRIGDKYVLMFLIATNMPVLLDSEGAGVFSSRQCGRCFITNNKGFMPISEYDAVLVYGKRDTLMQTSVIMDPEKRYLIESSRYCIFSKFRKCQKEPVVTSLGTRESYDLCGLCRSLLNKRRLMNNVVN